MDLSLSNVINISLTPTSSGLTSFNTANLLLLSTEKPINEFSPEEQVRIYKTASAVAEDFGVNALTTKMAIAVFSQAQNILSNSGALIIGLKGLEETQAEAYLRLKKAVSFCGFMTTDTIANDIISNYTDEDDSSSSSGDTLVSSLVNAEINKINFVVSNVIEDIDGAFTGIKDLTYKKTRCLFYGGSEEQAKIMMASYASRAMSTVFEGSNTTQTMHLKTLTGVKADPIITQSILAKCQKAGADVYVSFEGIPCVFISGANSYYDTVFNSIWFVNDLQVTGFNYLRETNTKIPQIEEGMTGLKDSFRDVCYKGIRNRFLAPGEWTSPDTFGDPQTFRDNINNSGFYIYSIPISKQSKEEREARKAPLCQIAIKEAGAIHSVNLIINVNR